MCFVAGSRIFKLRFMIPLVGFPCGTEYKYKHYQAVSCNLTVVPFALLHRFKPTHQQESSSYRVIINPCFLASQFYSVGFKLHFRLARYHN